MVQVDLSQLSRECNAWREQLRNFRNELTEDETKIQQVAGQSLSREQLLEVEHLHNQFHIQLINIHDLKQSIKVHDRKMNFEQAVFNGTANEDSLSRHENLFSEFQSLEQKLQELRAEFNEFIKRTH